jgi:hypothetical protein
MNNGRTVTGIKPRHVVLVIALCALSVPSLAVARPKRHPQSPPVRCVRGACVTHFLVEINGVQQTNWRLPFQRLGAADCFHVPYASGNGAQRIQFAGTGLVEATRFGRGAATFEYLRRGNVKSGIGAGAAHIARSGSYVVKVDPGPCGSNSNVGTYQKFHGCGQIRVRRTSARSASTGVAAEMTAATSSPTPACSSIRSISPMSIPRLDSSRA